MNLHTFSAYVVPVAIVFLLGFGILRRVPVFDTFLAGAREGISSSVSILPSLVGLILALSLAAAGLTVFLSQYSGGYIPMLLKALPLFVVVGAVLGSWLLDQPFTFRRIWENGPWMPKGTEFAVIAVLLLLGMGLCALTCSRQKKRELLE